MIWSKPQVIVITSRQNIDGLLGSINKQCILTSALYTDIKEGMWVVKDHPPETILG